MASPGDGKTRTFSYPRSGKEWTELRLLLTLEALLRRGIVPRGTVLSDLVLMSHFGYSQLAQRTRQAQIGGMPSHAERSFVIFRDPRAVLSSCYFFLKYKVPLMVDGILDNSSVPLRIVDDYLHSQFGTLRLISFVNDIDDLLAKGQYNVSYLYYEDMFNLSSLDILPEILGVEYSLTEREKEAIFYFSSREFIKGYNLGDRSQFDRYPDWYPFSNHIGAYLRGLISPKREASGLRNGVVDSYKKDLPKPLADEIINRFRKLCTADHYLKRYITETR